MVRIYVSMFFPSPISPSLPFVSYFSDAYRRFFYVAGVATHRETNAADSGSGFVIASDAVMHHTKVDGKRIVQPL